MIDPETDQKFNDLYRKLDSQKILVTQHKWWGYKSKDQTSIAHNIWTKILLDSTYSDVTCVSGLVNNGYPVKTRGIYLVIGKVKWAYGIAAAQYDAGIYLNAALFDHAIGNADANGNAQPVVTTLVPADIGDRIYLYAHHFDGTGNPGVNAGAKDETSLIIHLLSRQCK